MNLINNLVSFRVEDEYINGVHFTLSNENVKAIVSHFRNLGKWTEYYYYEIADYTLSHEEVCSLFQLRTPYWSDLSVDFDFQSLQADELINENYVNNGRWLCLKAFSVNSELECHFFKCSNDMQQIYSGHSLIEHLTQDELENIKEEIYDFEYDLNIYYYKFEWMRTREIVLDGKDKDFFKFD